VHDFRGPLELDDAEHWSRKSGNLEDRFDLYRDILWQTANPHRRSSVLAGISENID
jgi:hypothetical protein